MLLSASWKARRRDAGRGAGVAIDSKNQMLYVSNQGGYAKANNNVGWARGIESAPTWKRSRQAPGYDSGFRRVSPAVDQRISAESEGGHDTFTDHPGLLNTGLTGRHISHST
jgi:hypothetical protein